MTADDFRELLDGQELSELVSEDTLEVLRQQHIEQLLEEYEEYLNEQGDEELFGDEELEKLRQETIDALVGGYAEDRE